MRSIFLLVGASVSLLMTGCRGEARHVDGELRADVPILADRARETDLHGQAAQSAQPTTIEAEHALVELAPEAIAAIAPTPQPAPVAKPKPHPKPVVVVDDEPRPCKCIQHSHLPDYDL